MTRYVIKAPIHSITSDSREVEKDTLFIAYPGQSDDGRAYIAEAVKKGAVAVLWEADGFEWNNAWDVKNIAIPNLKQQAGHIASQFYKKPSSNLWMVGVTGTNGKTSVTQWVAQAFDYVQRKTAVIGTLGNGFLGEVLPSANTTPGPIELQRMLARYWDEQAQVVAMEVSSHALDQGRVNGVEFDVAVFTNLSRDHLDYHKTMGAYQLAKHKLFQWETLQASVINYDDVFGKKLADELNQALKHTVTYGIKSGEVRATRLELHDTHFKMYVISPYGNADVQVGLVGEFNVYNVLAVLCVLLVSGLTFDASIEAISQLVPVKGRMQMLGGDDLPLVVVDYAHTHDALEKVLTTLKKQTKSKLICVFGCGGDRDKGKREKMGRVVSQFVNAAVVTNDNPRYENPEAIVADIVKGMDANYLVELDRAKAITVGIMSAKPGDVVLIAGKGHEDYQEVAGVRAYFSDVEQAQWVLNQYGEVNS